MSIPNNNHKKTAWIFPGGSARCVYTAGVLYALCEIDVTPPDIIIGCSGSAPTSLCYVTGQKEVIKNVWLGYLSDRNFVNFWRFWKVVDVDYLVDSAIRKYNPLDMEKVAHSPITTYLPITNSHTGEITYVTNTMGLDMWEAIKATVSVPFWTNMFSVMGTLVNGEYYGDSSPSSRFQLHVKKAMKEGAERVIVFDNWHDQDNPTGLLYSKLYAYARNKTFRNNQRAYFHAIESFKAPTSIEYVKLSPMQKLGMGRFENNKENATTIFNQGYRDTIENKIHIR